MTLYFASIRLKDTIGPTIFADHVEASDAGAARKEIEKLFLRPIDLEIARDDLITRRFLETIAAKQELAKRDGYIVLARKSARRA